MGADDVGDGVVGPHVGGVGGGEVAEFGLVALVGSAVGKAAVGAVAGEVHGERDVAAVGPVFGPFFEGFAAAAVDEKDGGFWGVGLFWAAEVGEDVSGFSVEGFADVVEFLDEVGFFAPMENGRALQVGEVPRAGFGMLARVVGLGSLAAEEYCGEEK